MLIDGKKWACESCIKGHRVSSCTHKDRPLKEIAPKGRPVKQCEHCRGARKAKSHHAKCDCGDRKERLSKANLSGEIFGKLDADGVRLAMEEPSCVCFRGTKCSCGTPKREAVDPSLPSASHAIAKTRPKLTTAQSENSLMPVTNGQHRPCHRLNNAAHISGAPYRLPRAFHPQSRPGHNRTISIDTAQPSRNVSSPYGTFANGQLNNSVPGPGQATVDDMQLLGVGSPTVYGNLGLRSVDNLSSLYTIPMEQWTSVPTSAPTSAPSNPYLVGTSFAQSVPAKINDLSESRGQTPWMPFAVSQAGPAQYNEDSVIASPIGDWNSLAGVDWTTLVGQDVSFSAGDLPLNSSKLSNASMQPPSNSGESFQHSACGLTVSSGPRSEAGEFGFLNDLSGEWPPLEPSSTNASTAQSLYGLSGTGQWPIPESSSESDQEQDIEFYRSDTIKPPKAQMQAISVTIPSSVSPPSQCADTPSQYASAAASSQTSPVIFGDAWGSQPASATSYTFADSSNKVDIDPLSLSSSLEQVQSNGQNFDWDALLSSNGSSMYESSLPNPTSAQQTNSIMNRTSGMPMTTGQGGMWLSNQQ